MPGMVGHSKRSYLVGVDALRGLLAAKEFLETLLDLGDTGATTDKDDLRRDG